MYHENASTYTELLLRHCCALTVYSYWLVTCEVEIEVWSCYYYKCLTVLLQCPVFTTPLLASIHCKNGELYQMGNLIIYSNIIYSPPFSAQCSDYTLHHRAGVYVCTVQYVIPTISTIQNHQQNSWETFNSSMQKMKNPYFPTVFPPSLLTWQSRQVALSSWVVTLTTAPALESACWKYGLPRPGTGGCSYVSIYSLTFAQPLQLHLTGLQFD